MLDYLELNESANEKAHAIYNRIYNRQFREETQRDGSLFNEEDNLSVHSVVDDDSASSKSSIPLGQPDEEESDSDSSNSSDDQPSKSDKSSSDLSPTDSSFISDESKRARKSDGYTFDNLCQTEVHRQPKCGMYSYTNKVLDSTGQVYQSSQPVKLKGYPPGRFFYACSLWATGAKTPIHLLYDHIEGTFHHLPPSSVTALDADDIDKIKSKLPNNIMYKYETDLSIQLDTISKKKTPKTMVRFPPISRKMYPPASSVDKSCSGVEEPPVARVVVKGN